MKITLKDGTVVASQRDLNRAQWETIKALIECGGWCGTQDIRRHGGHHTSANVLVDIGAAESRFGECPLGFPFKEWRICMDWVNHNDLVVYKDSFNPFMNQGR